MLEAALTIGADCARLPRPRCQAGDAAHVQPV